MSQAPRAVDPGLYTEEYFLREVGGAEFYRLYGPRVVKPAQAYALRRAALEPGMKALDIGCGRGEILYQLLQRKVEAVGVDIAPPALAVAKQAMLEAGVGALPPLLQADAKKLPFPDASFDRIFFLGVLDHMHDWELEAAFAEFRRVLRPGGFVLANTCTNTQYYKSLSYGWRKKAAEALGLRLPTRMRSGHDEEVHVNEHSQKDLERFFSRIGWRGDIEARANDKLCISELYGRDLPPGFPIRPASSWKRFWMSLAFRGPCKRFLAREFFCTIGPAA